MAPEGTHTAGLGICLEGYLMVFTMPTAASNRHCQIQGTLVASLEDGRFWISIHIQTLKALEIKKSLLKKNHKFELKTLPGLALVTPPPSIRLGGWEPHSSLHLSQCGSLCRPLTQSACGSSPQSSLRDADGRPGLASVAGISHQLHFHVQD